MRGTLSPAFTSSKMRQMFIHVADCGKQMADYYLDLVKNKGVSSENETQFKFSFYKYSINNTAKYLSNELFISQKKTWLKLN